MLAFLITVFLNIFTYSPPLDSELSLDNLSTKPDSLNIDTLRLITIDRIILLGNKKTKDKIILRELDLKHGDTIRVWKLQQVLKKDQNRITNTRLFNFTEVYSTLKDNNTADIYIKVEERWYFFPVLILELSDPNFNVWWRQRNHALDRLEYGLRFNQKNFRGRNEEIKATVQFGFTKKIDFAYSIPYIDTKQRFGLRFSASYATNNTINYKTTDHILQNLSSDQKIRERFRATTRLSFRPGYYTNHSLEAAYSYTQINDTVAKLNPTYFLNGNTSQRYFGLRYDFKYDVRDIVAYPLKGKIVAFVAEKIGFTKYENINQWEFGAEYSKFSDLGKKFYATNQFKGRISFPQNQPYFNIRALGYRQDFVRGFDLNVIEGQGYLLNKNTLKWRAGSGILNFEKLIPWKQFNKVPLAVYLKTYLDFGYTHNNMYYPENQRLANKILSGGGFGVDIVTFYDIVFRLEESIDKDGNNRFFFYFKADI